MTPSISGVMKTSYQFFLKHRKVLFFFGVITAGIPGIMLGFHPHTLPDLTNLSFIEQILVVSSKQYSPFVHRVYDLFTIWSTIGVLLLSGLTSFYVYQEHKQASLQPFDLLKGYLSKLPKLILTGLLSSISIFARSLLLFIPGIIYGVFWLFAIQVVLYYDIQGLSAMKKSKMLVKGRRWHTFGNNTAYAIIGGFFALIPQILLGLGYFYLSAYPLALPILDTVNNLISIPVYIYISLLTSHFFLARDQTAQTQEPTISESEVATHQ